MNRKLSKSLLGAIASLVMVLGIFSIAIPFQEATAGHQNVRVTIQPLKNGVPYGDQYVSLQACSIVLNCFIEVNMPNRWDGAFERWCGDNPHIVVVDTGNSLTNEICEGSGPWDIFIQAGLEGGTSTHGSPISVHITVV